MSHTLILGLGIYFGFVGVVLFLPSVPARYPLLTWMRSLFPSWRFFEATESVPALFYRTRNHGGWSSWVPCIDRERRNLGHLFLNPRGSFLFACDSLVDQLLNELNESSGSEGLQKTTSYRLAEALVRQLAPADQSEFQFKLVALEHGEVNGPEDLMISPVLTRSPS